MEPDDVTVHREGDRMLDADLEPAIKPEDADEYSEWDLEPTFEKWRRGRTWS